LVERISAPVICFDASSRMSKCVFETSQPSLTALSGSTFLLNLNRANRFSTLNVPTRIVGIGLSR